MKETTKEVTNFTENQLSNINSRANRANKAQTSGSEGFITKAKQIQFTNGNNSIQNHVHQYSTF